LGRQNNDIKEVIRIHKSKKGRQNNDTKDVIRICKSKKGRQNNDTKEVIRIYLLGIIVLSALL
jgi:hypothetical protein